MLVIEARQGYALEVNEEMLNSKLESINALLNGSAQLKVGVILAKFFYIFQPFFE